MSFLKNGCESAAAALVFSKTIMKTFFASGIGALKAALSEASSSHLNDFWAAPQENDSAKLAVTKETTNHDLTFRMGRTFTESAAQVNNQDVIFELACLGTELAPFCSRGESRLSSQAALDLRDEGEEVCTRIEEKFLLPASLKFPTLDFISQHLAPAYLDSGTRFNWVESVYFDSDGFTLFKDHFLSPNRRFKLRLRRYAPDGRWQNNGGMLELKVKDGRVSSKVRLAIGHSDYWAILGQSMPLLPKGSRCLRRISFAIQEYDLKPKCSILYRRFAFERNQLRITLDDCIQSEMLSPISSSSLKDIRSTDAFALARGMRAYFLSSERVVLEVKHSGTIPPWLDEFLKKHQAADVSFSKYCFGVAGELA